MYYDKINRLLSLIANQIKTDPRFQHPEASRAMIEVYNDKAIDAFVRGLEGDVGKFLKNYKPDSLAAAYAYCVSFQNAEYRNQLTRHKNSGFNSIPRNQIPPLPPPRKRPEIINYQYGHGLPITLQYKSPPYNKPFTGHNNQPPVPHRQPFKPPIPQRNPFQQNKPTNKPEPMEVDPSIRTRQVNYGNRPQNSNQYKPPQKRPRMYNISSANQAELEKINEENLDIPEEVEYEQQLEETISTDSSFERYMQQWEHNENSEDFSEENVEFNFLG